MDELREQLERKGIGKWLRPNSKPVDKKTYNTVVQDLEGKGISRAQVDDFLRKNELRLPRAPIGGLGAGIAERGRRLEIEDRQASSERIDSSRLQTGEVVSGVGKAMGGSGKLGEAIKVNMPSREDFAKSPQDFFKEYALGTAGAGLLNIPTSAAQGVTDMLGFQYGLITDPGGTVREVVRNPDILLGTAAEELIPALWQTAKQALKGDFKEAGDEFIEGLLNTGEALFTDPVGSVPIIGGMIKLGRLRRSAKNIAGEVSKGNNAPQKMINFFKGSRNEIAETPIGKWTVQKKQRFQDIYGASNGDKVLSKAKKEAALYWQKQNEFSTYDQIAQVMEDNRLELERTEAELNTRQAELQSKKEDASSVKSELDSIRAEKSDLEATIREAREERETAKSEALSSAERIKEQASNMIGVETLSLRERTPESSKGFLQDLKTTYESFRKSADELYNDAFSDDVPVNITPLIDNLRQVADVYRKNEVDSNKARMIEDNIDSLVLRNEVAKQLEAGKNLDEAIKSLENITEEGTPEIWNALSERSKYKSTDELRRGANNELLQEIKREASAGVSVKTVSNIVNALRNRLDSEAGAGLREYDSTMTDLKNKLITDTLESISPEKKASYEKANSVWGLMRKLGDVIFDTKEGRSEIIDTTKVDNLVRNNWDKLSEALTPNDLSRVQDYFYRRILEDAFEVGKNEYSYKKIESGMEKYENILRQDQKDNLKSSVEGLSSVDKTKAEQARIDAETKKQVLEYKAEKSRLQREMLETTEKMKESKSSLEMENTAVMELKKQANDYTTTAKKIGETPDSLSKKISNISSSGDLNRLSVNTGLTPTQLLEGALNHAVRKLQEPGQSSFSKAQLKAVVDQYDSIAKNSPDRDKIIIEMAEENPMIPTAINELRRTIEMIEKGETMKGLGGGMRLLYGTAGVLGAVIGYPLTALFMLKKAVDPNLMRDIPLDREGLMDEKPKRDPGMRLIRFRPGSNAVLQPENAGTVGAKIGTGPSEEDNK